MQHIFDNVYFRVSYELLVDGIINLGAKTRFDYPFIFGDIKDAEKFIDDISGFPELTKTLRSLYPSSKFTIVADKHGVSIVADGIKIITYHIFVCYPYGGTINSEQLSC